MYSINFRGLMWLMCHSRIWRFGNGLVDWPLKFVRLMRDSREYTLKDQMSRSAISIASNIAEGAERGSNAELSDS